ncbi:MAG: hypothetical protein M1826_007454 [Phylliscum demangeonii]|nr:MAG: hypothetical protein M1826_007454 [Phylliscum demangeonii]
MSPDRSSSAAWTTARCNRLLRPLTSRVELLRKELDTSHRAKTVGSARAQDSAGLSHKRRRVDGAGESSATGTAAAEEAEEPDWMSQESARGRHQTQYSSRPSAADRSAGPSLSNLSGRTVISSPVLRRAYAAAAETNASSEGAMDASTAAFRVRATAPEDFEVPHALRQPKLTSFSSYDCPPLNDLKESLPPLVWALYVGLYRAFEALLKACMTSTMAETAMGPRSLFSTCLRQLPASIKANNALRVDSEGLGRGYYDSASAGPDMYEGLEALYEQQHGWKHLREVVKADGVDIISKAILDRLVCQELVLALIILCNECSAYDDAEVLLKVLFKVNPLVSPPSLSRLDLVLYNHLLQFTSLGFSPTRPKQRSSGFRVMADLVRNGCLTPGFLVASQSDFLWNQVVTSITEETKDAVHAFQFLEAMLVESLELLFSERETTDDMWALDDGRSSPSYASFVPNAQRRSEDQVDFLVSPRRLDKVVDDTFIILAEKIFVLVLLYQRPGPNYPTPRSQRFVQKASRLLHSLCIAIQRALFRHGVAVFRRKRHGMRRSTVVLLIASLLPRATGTSQSALHEILLTLATLMAKGPTGAAKDDLRVFADLTMTIPSMACHCAITEPTDSVSTYSQLLLTTLVVRMEEGSGLASASPAEQHALRQIVLSTLFHFSPGFDARPDQPEWLSRLQGAFKEPLQQMADGLMTRWGPASLSSDRSSEHETDDLCSRLARTPAITSRARRRRSPSPHSSDEDSPIQARRAHPSALGPGPKLSSLLLGSSPAPSVPGPSRSQDPDGAAAAAAPARADRPPRRALFSSSGFPAPTTSSSSARPLDPRRPRADVGRKRKDAVISSSSSSSSSSFSDDDRRQRLHRQPPPRSMPAMIADMQHQRRVRITTLVVSRVPGPADFFQAAGFRTARTLLPTPPTRPLTSTATTTATATATATATTNAAARAHRANVPSDDDSEDELR